MSLPERGEEERLAQWRSEDARGDEEGKRKLHVAREADSSGADKLVKLWDVGQRACVSTSAAEAEVWGVAWQGEYEGALAPGKQFAIAGDDKKVSLYRAAGAV